MSQRGSFVTEYIYCDKCFAAAKTVLLGDDKYLRGVTIPAWTGCKDSELPIIAGKINDCYLGTELAEFTTEIIPKLEKVICHPLRIAVLAEDDETLFIITPEKKE